MEAVLPLAVPLAANIPLPDSGRVGGAAQRGTRVRVLRMLRGFPAQRAQGRAHQEYGGGDPQRQDEPARQPCSQASMGHVEAAASRRAAAARRLGTWASIKAYMYWSAVEAARDLQAPWVP